MKSFFNERVREPSTYAGLAAVISGGGILFKINEAPAIAGAIQNAGGALAAGDWVNGVAVMILGIVAAFKKG